MKRIPQKAETLFGAYLELTKPSITFLILVSTALGYYLGGDGITDYRRFLITLIGSCLVSSGAGALNHFAEMESEFQYLHSFTFKNDVTNSENTT